MGPVLNGPPPFSFSQAVSFEIPGDNAQMRSVRDYVGGLVSSTQPTLGLGRVHEGAPVGSQGDAVLPGWSGNVGGAQSVDERLSSGFVSSHGDGRSVVGRSVRPARLQRPQEGSAVANVGDDANNIDDREPALTSVPEPPPRFARPRLLPVPRGGMFDALTGCVRRCCGLPSSTLVGKRATSVTATIVGDPASRSRAIFLRYGAFKRDAVMWVSARGGLMCPCFCGTQNALLLSETARNSDCEHTALLKKCLPAAGVPVTKFQGRMQLSADAANFASPCKIGQAVVWCVLYQSVFSLVTYTDGNVANCVAPGCRRFRGRCGHVRQSRSLNTEYKAAALADASLADRRTVRASKEAKELPELPSFIVSPDEDEGVEKMPSDAQRGKEDIAEGDVSRRLPRNMLPCVGETADGEVWARTADWLNLPRPPGIVDQRTTSDLEMMRHLQEVSIRLGYVRDVGNVLVEDYCGSCGTKRSERHAVIPEPASLYTHSATAPVLQVSCPSIASARVYLPIVG